MRTAAIFNDQLLVSHRLPLLSGRNVNVRGIAARTGAAQSDSIRILVRVVAADAHFVPLAARAGGG